MIRTTFISKWLPTNLFSPLCSHDLLATTRPSFVASRAFRHLQLPPGTEEFGRVQEHDLNGNVVTVIAQNAVKVRSPNVLFGGDTVVMSPKLFYAEFLTVLKHLRCNMVWVCVDLGCSGSYTCFDEWRVAGWYANSLDASTSSCPATSLILNN